jgi:glycosyltransferase involved in cell wall biosynthesis
VMASQPLPVRIGWNTNFRKLRHSDLVIAISRATRDDLVRLMGVDPERIRVVYPGIDHGLFNVSNAVEQAHLKDLQLRYGIGGRYLLYVGDSEWRKNLRRCLEALQGINPEVKLVLAGKRALTDARLHGWIEELGLDKRVILPGFVPDADLPVLYGGAVAFLFPSLYEGFGLPVAEAMACGCPVITSGVSSLPEVAGEAGLLVDPCSVAEIREAMVRVIDDADLCRQLTEAGVRQASRFSWERAAGEISALLREVAAS